MPLNSSRQSERRGRPADRSDAPPARAARLPRRVALSSSSLHDGVGLGDAPLGGEPARRLRHEPAQRNGQHRRDQPDDEHRLPAVDRHEEEADHAGEHQADREDHLVEQEEAAALLGTDELVDVGARDRHLAAGTDALKEAERHHRGAAPGEQAGDVHRDEQQDGDEEGLQPADLLGERPEDAPRRRAGRHSPPR